MILNTTPYQHQKDCFNFIQNLDYFALYMDMGTGKTRTILEYIYRKNIKKVLYFCPVSLKKTVENELIKHIKKPNYLIIDKQRKINNKYQFYICGIESINSDKVYLLLNELINKFNENKTIVIIDESSYIKNMLAKRTNRIIKLTKNIKYKCIMTGTPLTNYYQDLFSQMKFLHESILNIRSYFSFCGRYLIYHDKYRNFVTGIRNKDQLLKKINPYIFKIKKEDCLDLPKKTYQTYYFTMSEQQRDLYEIRKEKFFDYIQDKEYVDPIVIFELFSDLQRIVNKTYNNENPRIDLLLNIINNINYKFIIFCKYLNDIKLISEKLQNDCYIYTGNINLEKRNTIIIKSIKEKKHLLITYGVGGYGLNLTHYNNVIFFNSLFQYEKKIQAEARIDRIGQSKKMFFIDIICANSIDEKINSNLNNKEKLLNDFLSIIKNKNFIKNI